MIRSRKGERVSEREKERESESEREREREREGGRKRRKNDQFVLKNMSGHPCIIKIDS